jgi:outer membrane biosynthesis protein TonB
VPRILLEDTFDFKPDRTAIVESKNPQTGLTSKRIPGTLSVCDCINGNRRRYSKKVWEKNLAEGSVLHGLMSRRASFGLLEHPKDGKVDLSSPISHITVEAKLVEGKNDKGETVWFVKGCIEVLDTPDGRKLSSLIEAGYDPLVSSRGYGSLITAPDGVDEVQEDFVCEGWDVVSTPSFVQAKMQPSRQEKTQEAAPAPVASGTPATEAKISAPAPSSAKPIAENQKRTSMDIKQIRESISSLKAVNPATIDARSFAEGLHRMGELHNAAAKHLAENASASWDVGQLHKELSALEESWVAAFEAPRKEVKQLGENQKKLLNVVKQLTTVVSESRKVLGECRGKLVKSNEIAEAVAKRGRAWMETARRERDSGKVMEKKYAFTTEALDIMAGRYKADVAELGARVLELEFPSMTEDQKKALGEAKTPKAVLAVRESIEAAKKPTEEPAKKPVEEAKKPAAEPAKKPVEEAKKPAEEPAKTPVDEGKKPAAPAVDPKAPARPMTEGVEILRTDVTHSVQESMGMARRLSQGQAALRS